MEMKQKFAGYYHLTEDDFATLWENATFVFDTSVLLNLYRYPQQARDDLLARIEKLSDRIWLPYHVALEYQRNRLGVIAQQKGRFQEVQRAITDNISRLRTDLDNLQLKKRHSTIDVDELLSAIERRVEEFCETLRLQDSQQQNVHDADPLRERIDLLFDGKVGPAPADQSVLNEIYEDGEKRYATKTPPGFMDAEKEKGIGNSFQYGACVYRRKFGDLILWRQLLDHVTSSTIEHVVFVTDDDKEDWWWIVDSQGPKTIGPRPELVQEIVSESQVKLFYMYNSERFLQFASEFFKVPVREESIVQVQDVKKTIRGAPSHNRHRLAERAVEQWVAARFETGTVRINERGFPDILVEMRDIEKPLAFDTVFAQHPSMVRVRLRDRVYRAAYEVLNGDVERFTFVVVVEDEEGVEDAIRVLKSAGFEIPDGVTVVIGFLQESDNEEVFRPVSVLNAVAKSGE